MKKLASLFVVALLLSGCATPFGTFVTTTAQVLTNGGITNPITTQQIYNLEAAYGIAVSAAVAYRERPRCTKTALESLSNICARRSIVLKLQSADQKAQFALAQLKTFVTNNPTLDASDLFGLANTAVSAFTQLKDNVL